MTNVVGAACAAEGARQEDVEGASVPKSGAVGPDVNETLRKGSHNGWNYRDFPSWVRPELWDWLMETMGEDNVRIIALTSRMISGEPWVRGQILISDEGRYRLAKADRSKAPGISHDATPPPQDSTAPDPSRRASVAPDSPQGASTAQDDVGTAPCGAGGSNP